MKDSSKEKENLDQSKPMNLTELFKEIFYMLLICVVIYAGTVYIGTDNIRHAVESAGAWGLVVFMLFRILSIVIAPIGGVAFYLLAEPLFGFQMGFLYIYSSDLLAYTLVFFISRLFGRAIIHLFLFRTSSEYVDRVLAFVGTWQGFFYARLISFSFAELPSYVAGLTPLPYWQYIIITIPLDAVTILLFMLAGEAMSNKVGLIVTGIALLLAGLVFLIKRLREKRQQ